MNGITSHLTIVIGGSVIVANTFVHKSANKRGTDETRI